MKKLLSILFLLLFINNSKAQIDTSFLYDTVEVICLVSDETNNVYTITCYQVRYLIAGSNCCGNKNYVFDVVAYLDEKKKPILNKVFWSYAEK